MQHHFEARGAQQGHGPAGFGNGVAAAVERQDVVIHALGAHLQLGHAQRAQPGQLGRRNFVGAGLHRQPHVAVRCGLVAGLGFFQRSGFGAVEGLEAAPDEPFLVIFAIGAPGATQDQQLDLIRRVADGLQSLDAPGHLAVGVEFMLQPTPRPRLIGQVAFGHAHIGGAEDAVGGAGVGLGQHGDGGNAREGAHRLHADAFEQGRVGRPFAGRDKLAVNGHQGMLGQVAALGVGVLVQGLLDTLTGAHCFQRLAGLAEHFGGVLVGFPPGVALFRHYVIIPACIHKLSSICWLSTINFTRPLQSSFRLPASVCSQG